VLTAEVVLINEKWQLVLALVHVVWTVEEDMVVGLLFDKLASTLVVAGCSLLAGWAPNVTSTPANPQEITGLALTP
jgi:hypothetical protein